MKSGTNEKGAVSWIIKLILGVIVLVIVSVLLFGAFREASASILQLICPNCPSLFYVSKNPQFEDSIRYSIDRCVQGCNDLSWFTSDNYPSIGDFDTVTFGLCEQLPASIKSGSKGEVCGTDADAFPIEFHSSITADKVERIVFVQDGLFQAIFDASVVDPNNVVGSAVTNFLNGFWTATNLNNINSLAFVKEIATVTKPDPKFNQNWDEFQLKSFQGPVYISTNKGERFISPGGILSGPSFWTFTIVNTKPVFENYLTLDTKTDVEAEIGFNLNGHLVITPDGKLNNPERKDALIRIEEVKGPVPFIPERNAIKFIIESSKIPKKTLLMGEGFSRYFAVDGMLVFARIVNINFPNTATVLFTLEPIVSRVLPSDFDSLTEEFDVADTNEKILNSYTVSGDNTKKPAFSPDAAVGVKSIRFDADKISSITLDAKSLSNNLALFDSGGNQIYSNFVFHVKTNPSGIVPIVRFYDAERRSCTKIPKHEDKGFIKPVVISLVKENFDCSEDVDFNELIISEIEFEIPSDTNIKTVWIDGLRFTS